MERDPVTGKSLSGPILVCSLLMLAALVWALFDDAIRQRPWKRYQREFASLYQARMKKPARFTPGIRQIYVPEAQIVDRCESCHLGVREPAVLTAADMGNRAVFASHPNRALLELHDPDRFGCTLCHNGNGAATTSEAKAHGSTNWQWPLFDQQNTEAGCVACHVNDRVLDHAPTLNLGRDLYQQKGCAACHRHEDFDRDADALAAVTKEISSLEALQRQGQTEIWREVQRGDSAGTDEEARRHYALSETLRVNVSSRAGRLAELTQEARHLMQDRKENGPNLKDVRLKLRKSWIPLWLKDPQAFRPGTRMPGFRLSDQEVRALSAFVWQAGLMGPAPATQPRGNAERGKEIFETRGCLGCHSASENAPGAGGNFAANLAREGEMAGYDYLVRWVHDPRERTRPWCAREKRDLGPEDYARHGLPFVFDPRHDTCPNDGSPLQVQNMTVMPSLRLNVEEARDVATYLVSLKKTDRTGDAGFMDDPKLAETGKKLASRYGCGNCHELSSFEDTPRVGTELTKEASRPLEQLDFGTLERRAKSEGWYNRKGFFEHKLRQPEIYDQGRARKPEEQLRMPGIPLTGAELSAITTFLLGSVDVPVENAFRIIPAAFRYPVPGTAKTARQQAIQDGWWIVKKYNCMGCHTLQAGVKSGLSRLDRFQDPDAQEQLPPALYQEGARVNPEWLANFLENPESVRTYLGARMPTFSFSPREIRTLVKFFEALSGEPSPWIRPPLEPLSDLERQMARAIFSSPAAPCLKCHLTGDPRHDRTATAPNFLTAAARLKPGWTARWMTDPQNSVPGTAMPSGLFRKEGSRWVFAGAVPKGFEGYSGDHVDLLVRYMFQFDAAEQRRLAGTGGK